VSFTLATELKVQQVLALLSSMIAAATIVSAASALRKFDECNLWARPTLPLANVGCSTTTVVNGNCGEEK